MDFRYLYPLWTAQLILSISAKCIFSYASATVFSSLALAFHFTWEHCLPPLVGVHYFVYHIGFGNRMRKNCLFNISELWIDFFQCLFAFQAKCITKTLLPLHQFCQLAKYVHVLDSSPIDFVLSCYGFFYIAFTIWTNVFFLASLSLLKK